MPMAGYRHPHGDASGWVVGHAHGWVVGDAHGWVVGDAHGWVVGDTSGWVVLRGVRTSYFLSSKVIFKNGRGQNRGIL